MSSVGAPLRRTTAMVSNADRESGPAPALDGSLTLQVAALADELKALADRMETEWAQDGIVTSRNARQLRELREAAEQLLGAGISQKL